MKTDVFCQTSARKLGLTVNKQRARHYGVISLALMHYSELQHLSTLAQWDSCIQSCRWKLPISPFLMKRLVPFYPFSQDRTKLLWKFDKWSIKEREKKEQTKQRNNLRICQVAFCCSLWVVKTNPIIWLLLCSIRLWILIDSTSASGSETCAINQGDPAKWEP